MYLKSYSYWDIFLRIYNVIIIFIRGHLTPESTVLGLTYSTYRNDTTSSRQACTSSVFSNVVVMSVIISFYCHCHTTPQLRSPLSNVTLEAYGYMYLKSYSYWDIFVRIYNVIIIFICGHLAPESTIHSFIHSFL